MKVTPQYAKAPVVGVTLELTTEEANAVRYLLFQFRNDFALGEDVSHHCEKLYDHLHKILA